jgi:hypothetical protein
MEHERHEMHENGSENRIGPAGSLFRVFRVFRVQKIGPSGGLDLFGHAYFFSSGFFDSFVFLPFSPTSDLPSRSAPISVAKVLCKGSAASGL